MMEKLLKIVRQLKFYLYKYNFNIQDENRDLKQKILDSNDPHQNIPITRVKF